MEFRLKSLRKARKISQLKLALDLNINQKLEELLNNEFYICELKTSNYVYNYRITSKGKLLTNVTPSPILNLS